MQFKDIIKSLQVKFLILYAFKSVWYLNTHIFEKHKWDFLIYIVA